jgi:hypothetical protein
LAESPKESRSTSGSLSFSSARPYQSRNFDFDLRAKHSDTLFYEDLVAAGVAAMWRAALHFDSAAGYRFWTPAHIAVVGAISDEARLWRRGGSGEGKLDRWLYTHPTASPDQVLRAQARLLKRPWFRSFEEAAEGIKQYWAWGTDANIDFDEDMEAAAGTFRSMYDCFDPYQLSYSYSDSDGMAAPADSRLSYLEIHKHFSLVVDRLSGGLDTGCDPIEVKRPKAPRDLLDYTETAVVRFKNGKRQVKRQKALPGYRIRITGGSARPKHIGNGLAEAPKAAFDPLLTPGARNYWKTHDFTELADAAIGTIANAVSRLPGPECEVFIAHVGGAMSRVPTDATAYPHRGAHFIMNVHTRWREPGQDGAFVAWARELFTAAAPFATGSGYVNFMPADEPDRIEKVYGANYRRLTELKRRWDPENRFRLNQNIRPSH